MRTIATVAAVGLVLAACGSAGGRAWSSSVEGVWELQSGSVNGESVPVADGYRITLNSDGETFGGTSACNQYGGTIGVGPLFGEMYFTEMACQPAVMVSEQAYLDALPLIDTVSVGDDTLTLSGPGAELHFRALAPVEPAALIGTVWVLDTLIDGDAASTVLGEAATLEFDEDSTITAGTGCRQLTGTYRAVGDEIVTPELSATGECSGSLQSQDGHVVGVFEGGFTASVEGDRLTLSAPGGIGLSYRAP